MIRTELMRKPDLPLAWEMVFGELRVSENTHFPPGRTLTHPIP
jgi:hypothetical protein